jgi:hypothetical protein
MQDEDTFDVWVPPPAEPLLLRNFGDVVQFALGFELFEACEWILVLADRRRRVFGVVVDPPLDIMRSLPSETRALAIVRVEDVRRGELPPEDDLHLFQQLRAALHRRRIALVDLVHTSRDGELFRSLAIAVGGASEAE